MKRNLKFITREEMDSVNLKTNFLAEFWRTDEGVKLF